MNFTINGQQYNMTYYLIDGIYPKWATFIQLFTCPYTRKDKLFAEYQEADQKDVEIGFGGATIWFAIFQKPSLAWDADILNDIMLSCIIMHNMIIEEEREIYAHYADTTKFIWSSYFTDGFEFLGGETKAIVW